MEEENMINRILSIALLTASLCSAQEIKVVIAEGLGSSPQSAAQDAAQNALTNVVGSFIDANTQLAKRSEIRDGIRSQTTQIKSDVREYSQGSIQSFEVVETKKEESLFRITAKVGVRVEDFRAYIKKLAEGEVAVGSGLFAEMSTARKQTDSLAKILSDRILAIVNGEVIRFSVSKPVPLNRSSLAGTLMPGRTTPSVIQLKERFNPGELAVVEVTASLDDAFLDNLVKTFDSVAADKKRVSKWFGNRCDGLFSEESLCLPLRDATASTITDYKFPATVDQELSRLLPWGIPFRTNNYMATNPLSVHNLEIAVLDRDKKELQVEIVNGAGSGRSGEKAAVDGIYPWLLYSPVGYDGVILSRKKTFQVLIKLDDDALKQPDSIRVRLIK
jgi:hypothetical protein